MDALQPATQSNSADQPTTEILAKWSTEGLRLAIEFGKDLLAVQAQRRLAYEQRANLLLPLSGTLLVALAGAVYGPARFRAVGDAAFFLWLTVVCLFVAMLFCFMFLMAPPSEFAGVEPKEVMRRYASEAGEHGLLKWVHDEYQRRFDVNRRLLHNIGLGVGFATAAVALGVTYGGLMIWHNRAAPTPAATGTATQQGAPSAP
jgi:hypothetical protein